MPKIKKTKTQVSKKTADKPKVKAKAPKPMPVKKPKVQAAAPGKAKITARKIEKVKPPATVKKPPVAKPVLREKEKPQVKIEIPQAPAVKKEVIRPAPPKIEHKKEAPAVVKPTAPVVELKELELKLPVTVKDLAIKLQEKPSALMKILMDGRIMVSINHNLEEKVAASLCEKFGFRIKQAPGEEELVLGLHDEPDLPQSLKPRAPIVTLMGHVDHGKTSLLDAIRKSKVTDSEHGGITQHIGAYRVKLPAGEITFLDTPGHEAFTAMRARGAKITDMVVLVVAADDGVMPQTQEAIDHARAAGVSIIVALNKVDRPQANIDKVKKQLSGLNLAAEDWGGKTITVPVSAKTGEGIDSLLEMILLEAQMLELKANPNRPAKGIVIESKMARGRGPVSTLLIQNGTLKVGDNILVGQFYGKARALFNDHGQLINSASSSFPVEVMGISGIPAAGEQFYIIEDEKTAKELAYKRQESQRQKQIKTIKRISLEDLHSQIQEGKLKELKLIIKADVQGSLGAVKDILGKINAPEIKIEIIHEGVGNINSSDAILAVASNALILGFNVAQDEGAKELSAKEGIDVRTYNVIYELGNDIKAALEGMLEPKLKKVFLGRAEIRKVFKLSRSGTVAGCFVNKGRIHRASHVSVIRNGEVVFEGKLSSLKRFKDDVRDIQEGFECGMSIAGFENIQEGDIIEAYEIEKIARKL